MVRVRTGKPALSKVKADSLERLPDNTALACALAVEIVWRKLIG